MRVRLLSLPVLLGVLVVVASCGDEAVFGPKKTSSGGGSGGDGAQGGATTGGSTGSGGLFTSGCESDIICGAGECCEVGQECVLEKCLAACDSNVRCGMDLSICCQSGEVCLSNACIVPGGPCLDWADCAENEFCEPTLGKCLPQPSGEICEYQPEPGPIKPIVEWSWTTSAIQPAHVQVINMPVVVDLEQDGVPDVVIVSSNNYSQNGVGYLRALAGDTGVEKWGANSDVYQSANWVQPRGTPAAADIDGDGKPEIVSPKAGGGMIAFEHDGTFKWRSTTDGSTPYNVAMNSVTTAIADLEGDGTPEIVAAGIVFEADGKLRFNNGALAGSNNGGYGAVSIVANLDGKGHQEIVSGRRAWHSDGTLYWDNGQVDGYPAIGDLDLDGTPELVVIAAGTVRVQDPTTGAVLASLAMPAAGAGGPPTIANFDADPEPEIASANGGAYAVFGYSSNPTPTLSLQWNTPTQDLSSNRTGSSVFDFQGDGIAEVVYADECYFRVYNGPDGSVLFEIPNASATIHEYPVVVDVDGDNNTEVVVTANNLSHVSNGVKCPYPGNMSNAGVFVYGDANDNWVRTRKIWNQHAYHITNINANSTVPAPESPSWLPPKGFNNYRQSTQGAGVFNAPDLKVSLSAALSGCPSQITLKATVQNQGSLGVAAGIPVSFFAGTDANAPFIATVSTTKALLPGELEVVSVVYDIVGSSTNMSFFVVVDADKDGNGTENECLEDNNNGSVDKVSCPDVT